MIDPSGNQVFSLTSHTFFGNMLDESVETIRKIILYEENVSRSISFVRQNFNKVPDDALHSPAVLSYFHASHLPHESEHPHDLLESRA